MEVLLDKCVKVLRACESSMEEVERLGHLESASQDARYGVLILGLGHVHLAARLLWAGLRNMPAATQCCVTALQSIEELWGTLDGHRL